MRVRTLLLLAAALVVCLGAVAQSAKGRLVVNGEETELRHAYAIERDNPFERGQREIVLFLTDVPVEDIDLHDLFAVKQLGTAGKLRAVEVTFTLEGEVKEGRLYHPAGGDASVMRSGTDDFEKQTFSKDLIAGKLAMRSPSELTDLEYIYQAEFSAPIQRALSPELKGAEAVESGPGKVVAEFMRAALKRDLAAVQLVAMPDFAEILQQYSQDFFADAAQMFGKVKIARVYERGERAIVEVEGVPADGPMKFKAYRVGGVWKVGRF